MAAIPVANKIKKKMKAAREWLSSRRGILMEPGLSWAGLRLRNWKRKTASAYSPALMPMPRMNGLKASCGKRLSTGISAVDLMHYGGDQHYYETRMKQAHAHVVCLRCGKVEEFYGEPLQRLRRQIEMHFGFQILVARTEVGGYCSNCQGLRAREMEEAAAAAPLAVTPKERRN